MPSRHAARVRSMAGTPTTSPASSSWGVTSRTSASAMRRSSDGFSLATTWKRYVPAAAGKRVPSKFFSRHKSRRCPVSGCMSRIVGPPSCHPLAGRTECHLTQVAADHRYESRGANRSRWGARQARHAAQQTVRRRRWARPARTDRCRRRGCPPSVRRLHRRRAALPTTARGLSPVDTRCSCSPANS